MSGFTSAEKLACAERELRMRERIYPRRVADGGMSSQHADKELALMRAIAADYRAAAAEEQPDPHSSPEGCGNV